MIQTFQKLRRNYKHKALIKRASAIIYSDRFVESLTVNVESLTRETAQSDEWPKRFLAQWALRLVARHEPESAIDYISAMELGYHELVSFEKKIQSFQGSLPSDLEELTSLFLNSANAKTEFELECIHAYLGSGKEAYLSNKYSFEAARFKAEMALKRALTNEETEKYKNLSEKVRAAERNIELHNKAD